MWSVYNIYDECGQDDRRRKLMSNTQNLNIPKSLKEVREILSRPSVVVETSDSFSLNAGYAEALNDYSCGAETAMDAWLAEPTVVSALHVTTNTPGEIIIRFNVAYYNQIVLLLLEINIFLIMIKY